VNGCDTIECLIGKINELADFEYSKKKIREIFNCSMEIIEEFASPQFEMEI